MKASVLFALLVSFADANLILNRNSAASPPAPIEFFEDDFSSDMAANGWVANTGSFTWDSGDQSFTMPRGSLVNPNFQMTSQNQWVVVRLQSSNSENGTFAGPLLRAQNNATTPRLTLRNEKYDLVRFRGLSQGDSGTGGNSHTAGGDAIAPPEVWGFAVEGAGLGASGTIGYYFQLGDTLPNITASTPSDQVFGILEAAAGGAPTATLTLDGSQSNATGDLLGFYNGGSATLRWSHIMGGTWTPAPSAPPRFEFEPDLTALADDGTSGSAVGDLDNDGDDEFIVQRSLKILDWNGVGVDVIDLGKDSGRLDRWSGDLELADFNGDNFLDLICTDSSNTGNTGELVIFVNPGTLAGTWTEISVFTWDGSGPTDGSSGARIRHCEEAIGDFDNDGNTDIIVRDIRYGTWVFINDGTFTNSFNPPVYLPHNPREGLAVGDIDGDGDDDFAINGLWYESNGAGGFTQHVITAMADWYPAGQTADEIDDYAAKVRLADFNEDGRLDIVISNSEELEGNSPGKPLGIRVFLAPLDPVSGTWTEQIVEPARKTWHSLKIADFDADGHLDIFAGSASVGVGDNDGGAYIYPGNGDGTFADVTQFSGLVNYQSEIGDIDGDGKLDFLLPGTFNNNAVILIRGK